MGGGPGVLRWGLRLAGAAVLASCTFAKPLAQDALSFNKSLAVAANRQLLLNALRASRKHAMFFTAVPQVTQVRESSLTASMPVPLDKDFADAYKLTTGLATSAKPAMTIGVLDGERFMRGIMTPVKMELFRYYWEEGWNKETLLLLFVRRVDVVTRDDGVPDAVHEASLSERDWEQTGRYAAYDAFHDFLMRWTGPEVQLRTVSSRRAVSPPLTRKEIASYPDLLANLAGFRGGYDLVPVEGAENAERVRAGSDDARYVLMRGSERYAFRGGPGAEATVRGVAEGADAPRVPPPAPAPGEGPAAAPPREPAYVLYLRSPEAVLYHLGQIIRATDRHPEFRVPLHTRGGIPLFRAVQAPVSACGELEADYDGCHYVIPADPAESGESMHVLSLVAQLIALQKSAEEMPSGGVLQVISR
jgi:hypothetical protein